MPRAVLDTLTSENGVSGVLILIMLEDRIAFGSLILLHHIVTWSDKIIRINDLFYNLFSLVA